MALVRDKKTRKTVVRGYTVIYEIPYEWPASETSWFGTNRYSNTSRYHTCPAVESTIKVYLDVILIKA